MRCIFCKLDSHLDVSIEHIIPESLGNNKHVLPVGVVCDNCNQYFANKIERPLLESTIFRLIKSDRQIPNKRRRIPKYNRSTGAELPDFRIMSRFVGKVGLEVLAQRTLLVEGSNVEIVEKEELDELREYVRFDHGEVWPLTYRTLYPVNGVFHDGKAEFYEVFHEYDLLYTESFEFYIVLVLFGVEFALNLGGRLLDGYEHWLKANNEVSPLYFGKNLFLD